MSLHSLLLARLQAIVEGSYPVTPVTGRSIATTRFRLAKTSGGLSDPGYPIEDFHRRYELVDRGFRRGEPLNARSGFARRVHLFDLNVGYVYGFGGPGTGVTSTTGIASRVAEDLSGDDAHALEQALTWPDFWGTLNASPLLSIYGIAIPESVPEVLIAGRRLLRRTRLEVGVSYVPGGVYT